MEQTLAIQPVPYLYLSCTWIPLQGYNKNAIPGGGDVQVEVDIWVQEVSKIIEINSEFELDIYVTEQWMDQNLAFDHLHPCKLNLSLDGMTLICPSLDPRSGCVKLKAGDLKGVRCCTRFGTRGRASSTPRTPPSTSPPSPTSSS